MSPGTRGGALGRALLLLATLVALGRVASKAWFGGAATEAEAPVVASRAGARPVAFLLGIVDGLREEAVAPAVEPVMPFWRELAAEGASGIATTGEPTLTSACVRTLLSGRNPDLASAASNFDAPVARGNLIERLHAAGMRVGHAGDAAAWQLARPSYTAADVLAVPDQGPADQGATDDRALAFALGRIADGVDALTVHLTGPDHAGHLHGADLGTPGAGRSRYAAACLRADDQLRAIVKAFRRRHPEAVVVLAADHGVTVRGTHGGGELAARRAPFVAVGSPVRAGEGAEISQAALASTMAAWLRVAPLPFSESPPALEWTTLLPFERRVALEAWVDARLAVATSRDARSLADAIAARRATIASESTQAALARLAEEARVVVETTASAHDAGLVALALALAALLWFVVSDDRPARGVGSGRVALAASAGALLASVAIPGAGLACASLAASVGAWFATRAGRRSARGALASLLVFPALSAAVFVVKPVLETAAGLSAGIPRLAAAVAALVAAGAWGVATPSMRARGGVVVRSAPGVLLAVLGVLIGFPTSLRPFVDPFVDLAVPYAAFATAALAVACLSPAARVQAPRARFVALALASAALWAPLPGTPVGLAAVPAFAVVAAGALGLAGHRGGRIGTASGPLLAAAAAALAAAVARAEASIGAPAYFAIVAAALGALVATLRGRGDLALATRILSALALALLFERRDDAAAIRFLLLGVAAFAAARLRAPSSRGRLVLLAAFCVLLRVVAFHALGCTESLSTVDTGAGVVPGFPADPGPSQGVSGAVLANVAAQALRFSLPWIVLLATASRMIERRGNGPDGDRLRFVGDVASIVSIRGAALVLALWIWWPQSWWVSTARAVYAFAVGDVVLVLLATALTGGFSRTRADDGLPDASRALA